MEALMAAKKPKSVDFESRYFDDLDEWRDGIDSWRVVVDADRSKVNMELFGPQKKSDLPPWYRDTKWVNVIFIVSLVFLLLVANATHFDLTRIKIGG